MDIHKKTIQDLILRGETAEALHLLNQSEKSQDTILLLSRFNRQQKVFEEKKCTFEEWAMVQSQINYAILQLFVDPQPAQKKTVVQTTATAGNAKTEPSPAQIAQIREMLANNQSEEAIELLSQYNLPEVNLIQQRFLEIKTFMARGIIRINTWSEEMAKLQYALLDLLDQFPSKGSNIAFLSTQEPVDLEIIRKLLEKGSLAEALLVCKLKNNTFILLNSRFIRIQENFDKGLIKKETYEENIEQLKMAVLAALAPNT